MTSFTIEANGDIRLPPHLCSRYGFQPKAAVRIIELRNGIMLVPLTDEPMNPELSHELADWQDLSTEGWQQFPFEDAQA